MILFVLPTKKGDIKVMVEISIMYHNFNFHGSGGWVSHICEVLRSSAQWLLDEAKDRTIFWGQITPLKINMDVSENNGTPKSSILIGFSIINHPFWGTLIFGNTHMEHNPGGLDLIVFLSKWVICRFHVSLPGCIANLPVGSPQMVVKSKGIFSPIFSYFRLRDYSKLPRNLIKM